MSPYNPYLTPQQRQSNEMALQQQIGYLQSQLQNLQAQDQMQQPMMQNQMQHMVQGVPSSAIQIVENFDKITAESVPMDSRGAYFMLSDESAIQHRTWNNVGEIKPVTYKRILDPLDEQAGNSSPTSEKHVVSLSDDDTGVFMKRFDEISARLGVLEQSILGVQDVKEREVRHGESANSYNATQSNDNTTTEIRTERPKERVFQQFRDVDERPSSGSEWGRTADERNRTEYVQEP